MPSINPRPLSTGELADLARRQAEYRIYQAKGKQDMPYDKQRPVVLPRRRGY